MSEEKPSGASVSKEQSSLGDRRVSSRRKLLKTLVTGGGAVVAAKTLPSEWTRPIVDRIILPVHAQSTGMLTLNAQVEVQNFDSDADGTDGDGVGIYPAGINAIDGADDSTMNFLISGTLSPATAQSVSVTVDVTGGDLDTGASLPLAPVIADGTTGAFAFPTIGTDDIPDNTAETLTITVSTAGAADSVIVINFNGGALP
jgi:hypothetical protein